MASSQSHLDLVQLLIVVVMTMTMLVGGGEALSLDYYAKSCPKAEAAVAAAVKQAMAKDRTVPAGLLRLHFHDCFVRNRIQPQGVDPALHPSFAATLRRSCPPNNTARSAGSSLDPTSSAFDNFYYRMLLSGRGLLSSDEALLTHPKTRAQVTLYAASQPAFFRDFVDSMLRMSSLNNVAGEVRANCRRVN
ncbi:hypothetical protein OsJ_09017 [Oryza sativa Japonica Group]|uniref:Plant heme peroxidase family profile domain-containing protein n=1 Tax=Oryza sativa subsp. japonica TaxID=39947 RepID=A3AD28_ORYSJ|nr:hypothetical protein OsJ_09017 [Oryza sativa Japonica Group]